VELETVKFECQFSGTPTPGKFYVSWQKSPPPPKEGCLRVNAVAPKTNSVSSEYPQMMALANIMKACFFLNIRISVQLWVKNKLPSLLN
jgi:hypothetical protein